MASPGKAGVLRLVEEHGLKLLRYCGVSIINVFVGMGTFLACLTLLDFSPLLANICAWIVSTGPAYLLSRYWVWEQSGTNSVRSEIAPFWIIALIGLGFSSVCVTIAGRLTEWEIALLGVQLAAYGVVWVARYLVLDQFMWRRERDEAPVTEVV